jgi:hypothetical protein
VCSWTGYKVESGPHAAVLQLLEAGLGAQMLGLAPVRCYPLQEPLVALVLARHLQSDHAEPSERHYPVLTAGTEHGQAGPDPHQPEPCSKVRVVLQGKQKLAERHGWETHVGGARQMECSSTPTFGKEGRTIPLCVCVCAALSWRLPALGCSQTRLPGDIGRKVKDFDKVLE